MTQLITRTASEHFAPRTDTADWSAHAPSGRGFACCEGRTQNSLGQLAEALSYECCGGSGIDAVQTRNGVSGGTSVASPPFLFSITSTVPSSLTTVTSVPPCPSPGVS
jgi:hypothetical protein